MKYDDAAWHYEGQFPDNLPIDAGGTHIAMFLAWCLLNGLAGERHTTELSEDLAALRRREVTPGKWFIRVCDGKLTDDNLNDAGNAFATAYYHADQTGYVIDYEATLCQDVASVYHVPDNWQTFDTLAPVIASKLDAWNTHQPSSGANPGSLIPTFTQQNRRLR